MLVQKSLQFKVVTREPGCVIVQGGGFPLRVSEDVAEVLVSLSSEVELSSLTSARGLNPTCVARLIQGRVLVDSEDGSSQLARLSSFFPRFLGSPDGALGEADVTVIGVPFDVLSQTGSGTRAGPAALRVASSQLGYRIDNTDRVVGWFDSGLDRHVLADVTFADAGDIELQVGDPVSCLGSQISYAAQICAGLGSLPVFLGGDHSLSYWTIDAIRRAHHGSISVLHLDAHSDLSERTETNVPTNGSFARHLVEENPELPFVTAGLRGYLGCKQLSLSPAHKLITGSDLVRQGHKAVLSLLPEGMPCYVSLDVDVLDPAIIPATNTPIPGGLRFEEVQEILAAIGAERRIVGVDIVELNPDRDLYSRSALTALYLILALLGSSFSRARENCVS